MKFLAFAICIAVLLFVAALHDFLFRLPKIKSDLDEANGGIDDDEARYQRELKIAATRKHFGP